MTTPYDHTGGDRLTLEQQLNKIAGQEARKCAQKTTIPRLRIANEILRERSRGGKRRYAKEHGEG